MKTTNDLPADALRINRSVVTLRQQVVEALRGAILNFHYKPGDRLIERELCERTGVSRTSVREALRHLESEGLITNLPNRGPEVARVTVEEAREIYEVRGALEALAGRLFTQNAQETDLQRLRTTLKRLEAAFANRNKRKILVEATRFYDVLLDGCGNKVVCGIIRSLHARITYLRATSMSQVGRAPDSLAEMKRIAAALFARDAQAAYDACYEHVRKAERSAIEVLKSQA
jgi:DNA-binding GntR family transcriptional regulator